MYSLPEDFDYKFLSGCYLETICFGAQITTLNFKRPQKALGDTYGVSLGVEGGLLCGLGGVTIRRQFSDSRTSSALLDLILEDVDDVERYGSSGLKVVFASGSYLVVEAGMDDEFESYSIYLDTGEIIVI